MTTPNKSREYDAFRQHDPVRRPECVISEDMLADALDGTLTAADQLWLDRHVATCAACATMLADAKRGAAWLDLLKLTRPEPSADLFARIMAQTSGDQTSGAELTTHPVPHDQRERSERLSWEVSTPAHPPAQVLPVLIPTNLLSFPAGRRTLPRGSNAFSRMFLEPRLAMTAAMAFFSIALTLNLTGVRLNEVHASDLTPTNLRRDFYQARAGAVRQYDSLRMVQVLESRVDDLRDTSGPNSTADQRDSQSSRPSTPAAAPRTDNQPDAPAHPQRERMAIPRTPATRFIISRNTPSPADDRVLSTYDAGAASDSLLYPGGF